MTEPIATLRKRNRFKNDKNDVEIKFCHNAIKTLRLLISQHFSNGKSQGSKILKYKCSRIMTLAIPTMSWRSAIVRHLL